MKTEHYYLQLTSPAFLGDVQQKAQWRTPPIKAILRQWWRCVWMANNQFPRQISQMREAEGLLFGHAWLENDKDQSNRPVSGRKSRVLIRLLPSYTSERESDVAWRSGSQRGVDPLPTTPETNYAWFGLDSMQTARMGQRPSQRIGLKANRQEGLATLALAAPESDWADIQLAMSLINMFGTFGSRNRGGWGSLQLHETALLGVSELLQFSQPLEKCLERDWPHAIAVHNDQLCIWESNETFKTWDEVLRFIAIERKAIRRNLTEKWRPVLGFAAGRERMPSPLRWKVIATPSGLRARVFAMPHDTPHGAHFSLQGHQLLTAWNSVCDDIDSKAAFQRFQAKQVMS